MEIAHPLYGRFVIPDEPEEIKRRYERLEGCKYSISHQAYLDCLEEALEQFRRGLYEV